MGSLTHVFPTLQHPLPHLPFQLDLANVGAATVHLLGGFVEEDLVLAAFGYTVSEKGPGTVHLNFNTKPGRGQGVLEELFFDEAALGLLWMYVGGWRAGKMGR